jgi:hypothetical protein
MAEDNTEAQGSDKPMSMKDRLLAQRRAQEKAEPSKPTPPARPASAQRAADAERAPAVPASRPAAPPKAAPASAAPGSAAPGSAAPGRAAPARASAAQPAADGGAPAKMPRQIDRPSRLRAGGEAEMQRRSAQKAISADVQREVDMLRKRQDQWILYGWIVAGVLVLGAGGFWLYVQAEKQARIDARVAYETSIADLVSEITGISPTSVENANKIIARAEATRNALPDGTAGWKGTYVEGAASKIAGHLSKATNFIEDDKRRRELTQGLEAIESAARDASSKSPDELATLRRRIADYENRGSGMGVEFEARVAKAKIDISRAYVRRLVDEAKRIAASSEPRQAALIAFTRAEDELRTLMDDAYQRRNQEAIDFAQPLYEQIITDSDALVTTMFTPQVIERTPWRDLLAAADTEWVHDGLKGFRAEGGSVQAVGMDPGSKREGIFSVGDREKWRDFIMEVEFVPVRGTAKLYWRLGKQVQSAPDEVIVDTATSDWKAGQTYGVTATYLGSKRVFEWSANRELDPEVLEPISWRRQRLGAFGAVVSEGSEIKITKLRIKVLR